MNLRERDMNLNSGCESGTNDNTKDKSEMAEFASDMPEEKESAAANATSTCDKRHCREMRKEKLPPYLRDKGIKFNDLFMK